MHAWTAVAALARGVGVSHTRWPKRWFWFSGWGMSVRGQLNDRQWAKIEAFHAADYKVGEPGKDDRNFIEAVLCW